MISDLNVSAILDSDDYRDANLQAEAGQTRGVSGDFSAQIGSVENPDSFFFMRGFPDLESREPMKARFYEGELWKNKLENLLMPMIEKYDVVLVDDPGGIIRWQ